MGMLPPDAASSGPKGVVPVDPTMQGATRGRPRGEPEVDVTDVALRPGTAPHSGNPVTVTNPYPKTVTPGTPGVAATPNQFVDPLMVERLRAKARSGYAGTFLTGPQGVLGLGSTLLGGGK